MCQHQISSSNKTQKKIFITPSCGKNETSNLRTFNSYFLCVYTKYRTVGKQLISYSIQTGFFLYMRFFVLHEFESSKRTQNRVVYLFYRMVANNIRNLLYSNYGARKFVNSSYFCIICGKYFIFQTKKHNSIE